MTCAVDIHALAAVHLADAAARTQVQVRARPMVGLLRGAARAWLRVSGETSALSARSLTSVL
jgi:hypothetical protein